MKTVIRWCLLASGIYLTGCGGSVETNTDITKVDPVVPVSDWEMVWSDEFDGDIIDESNWTYEVYCGGGNQERQCYTENAENSFVSDGTLKIVALPAADGAAQPFTSARLNSRYKADFKYGRFEMSAKLPSGQGSWPAFWMKSTDEVYGTWPKSGEIDIMESINLKTTDAAGAEETAVSGSLHYGKFWPNNSSSGMRYHLPNSVSPADGFHTYAVEWQEGEIRWYVDDVLYQTQRKSEIRYNGKGEAVGLSHKGWFSEYFDPVTGELESFWDNSPFDQEFFMLLNFAVGGNHPEDHNDLGIDETAFQAGNTFEVEYVRVYQCSLNPDTGKGCETVGAGGSALVEGKAPPPPAPVQEPTGEMLEIFVGALNPSWPAWFSNGTDTPELVTDADKGDVVEFSVGADSTVAGFISREEFITDSSGSASPHNASADLEAGFVRFDMKVVAMPENPVWTLKIESDNAATAVNMFLTESLEGKEPVEGEWQTYTFSLQALFDKGLDLSLIDVVMIYPGWSSGEGAVYRIANLHIGSDNSSLEVALFEDAENNVWPMWNSLGDTTPVVVVDEDDAHGAVAEFSIVGDAVTGFASRENVITAPDVLPAPFDATSLVANGVMQFDLKVVTMPFDPSVTWYFKAESVGAATFAKVALTDSIEGAAPSSGEWQTYTFKLSDLEANGLDLSSIDIFLIYPNWGEGAGATYRIDNAKIYDLTASEHLDGFLMFGEKAEDPWSIWDCCGGSTPTVEMDDTNQGMVAEFVIGGSNTLAGFKIAEDGVYMDASSALPNGVVEFDLKVIDPITNPDGYWQIKMESGDQAADHTFKLTDSLEGLEPVTGQWQTFTFTLQSFFDAGIDVSEIDILAISPNWSGGAGAKYRLDNVRIYDAGSMPKAEVLTIYEDGQNSDWPSWDSCACSTPTDEDDAEHGAVAEFVGTSQGTVFGFRAQDGIYFDASDLMASDGVLRFDFKMVAAPNDSSAVFGIKVESGDAASNVKFNLSESYEGVAPTVGEWQTYTYPLTQLSYAGLDVSEIDVVLVYPGFGTSAGSVFRIDNVAITTQ